MAQKIVLTILALIALYLILANGGMFNTILGTAGDTAIRGVTVLQGRNGKDAK